MEMSVDIQAVKDFVTSDKFSNFILKEQSDFTVAAFILQSLFEAIDKAEEKMKEV